MADEQLPGAGLKQVQLSAVREILRATTAALPLPEILPLIANVTIIAFDAQTAWLMLVAGDQLSTVVARGEHTAQLQGSAGDLATSTVGWAARSQQATILQPFTIDPADPILGPLAQQPEPVVLVPITAGDQVRGVLGAVVSLEAVHDLGFLVTLAGQAAVAIEDARLRAEAQTWRRRLDAVVEQMHDLTLVYDRGGALVLASARAEQWLQGWGVQIGDRLPEVVRKMGLCDPKGQVIAPEDSSGARALHGEVLNDVEMQITVLPEREPRFVLVRAMPLYTDGQIDGAVVVMHDITARQQAEAQVRFQAHLLDTVEEAVIATDPAGMVMFWNSFAEELYGWSAAEATGRNIVDLTVPDLSREQALSIMERLAAGESWAGEHLVRRRDGTTFPALVRDTPIRDDAGNLIGVIGLSIDNSERKRAEEERAELLAREQAARAEAQEAVRTRDAFLGIAAHEIKNPLSVILGQAQLLQSRANREGTLNPRDQRALAAIAEQARRLNSLITAMLDVSLIEQKQLMIRQTPVDLCALVRRIVTSVQPTLDRHALGLTAPEAPLVVAGDALRLEQVFSNLINNAIKYSPQGGTITVEVSEHADQARVTVTDEGIGIPQDVLPNLFQRFYRADNAASHRLSGTGIGLYVVKELITLHGGVVEVDSTEGRGSTFTVLLPRAAT